MHVEPERLDAYEQMFEWRPQFAPLLEPAKLEAGQRVVDWGCGPGGLAVELARRVGPAGRVFGFDLNAQFLERARQRAARDGVSERIDLAQVSDERIPLPDAAVDRVVCKNVLEYVPDLDATLTEFRRVLVPGGLAHAIDSDWGLLAVEPIGPERIAELFAAASVAYRTPLVGRKLYGAFRRAGFREPRVLATCPTDTRGLMAPIILNMAGYARASGRMERAKIDGLVDDLKRAIADGTYLLVLPQFLVTGEAPG